MCHDPGGSLLVTGIKLRNQTFVVFRPADMRCNAQIRDIGTARYLLPALFDLEIQVADAGFFRQQCCVVRLPKLHGRCAIGQA